MRTWVDSFECRSGEHCAACRSTGPRGLRFRASLRTYALPMLEATPGIFKCPHGVELDAQRGKTTAMPQAQDSDGGCGCSPPCRE